MHLSESKSVGLVDTVEGDDVADIDEGAGLFGPVPSVVEADHVSDIEVDKAAGLFVPIGIVEADNVSDIDVDEAAQLFVSIGSVVDTEDAGDGRDNDLDGGQWNPYNESHKYKNRNSSPSSVVCKSFTHACVEYLQFL